MDHGLVPASDGSKAVSLACKPSTEAAVFRFAARDAIQHVFHRLGSVLVPVVVACGSDTEQEFMWLPEGSREVAAALSHGIHVQYVGYRGVFCCETCITMVGIIMHV